MPKILEKALPLVGPFVMPYSGGMHAFEELVRGKRVTVLGLGLLGRSVGDAEFLAKCGAKVTVTDKKTEEELRSSVDRLKQYPNITFHLGGHTESDFTDTNMVIKSAGVRTDSPEIAAARGAGVPVYMSTALFAKYAMEMGAKVVGITGTRGKSTTTQMIYEALKSAAPRQGSGRATPGVLLGGNVRGVSTLAQLPEVTSETIAVLELDSWQLQGFGDLGISPQVAVFTNLLPDHQNYYPDMETYFNDKALIFRNQKPGDTVVAGQQIAEQVRGAKPPANVVIPQALPAGWELKVPGEHNRDNAACARAALLALGVDDKAIRASLGAFTGVAGRLQLVGTYENAQIYNDNNATTPDATVAALEAFRGKRICLITGGTDKGLSLETLAATINERVSTTILLSGTGSDRLRPLLQAATEATSLTEAVDKALAEAETVDVIIFSPAFASFGMFANEYDRNDQFMALLRARGI